MYVADACHKNNYVYRCYANVADRIATVAVMCHMILLMIVVGWGRWNSHCGSKVNYFNLDFGVLNRASSQICDRWYLPVFLLRDGPLTLCIFMCILIFSGSSEVLVCYNSATMAIPSATPYNNHQQYKVVHICHIGITSFNIIILVTCICHIHNNVPMLYNYGYNIWHYTCVYTKSQDILTSLHLRC